MELRQVHYVSSGTIYLQGKVCLLGCRGMATSSFNYQVGGYGVRVGLVCSCVTPRYYYMFGHQAAFFWAYHWSVRCHLPWGY